MPYTALRTGRRSIAGQEYLVTTVTHARRPLFTHERPRAALIDNCRTAADLGELEWLAWVVMPDHFHGLLRLGNHLSLSECIRRLKGRTARKIPGPVWQPSFHDHALRADEDRNVAARYLLANPVRAGLCRRLRDYPHWYCSWLAPGDDTDAFLIE